MLSSCTYMGIKTQTEGPFAGSSCWAPVLQPAGSEVLSCTCSWGREQSKRWSCSACSSAVTVFDKVLVISEAEWGSLVEEGEDRWGRVSCSMGSGVSPSPHLPSASSFQTCKGRFFSWFYLDTTYIDGDFSIEKQISRTTEHLKHLPISSGYWKHSKPAQCEVSWSQLGLWPEAFMGRYPEPE